MRRSIIAVLSLLCIEANQISAHNYQPTTEVNFYVPDYPNSLNIYISAPQLVCQFSNPLVTCSAPIVNGDVGLPFDGHIAFSTFDNSKWCSYDFFVSYNSKYKVNDLGIPVLSFKNMNCDATVQQTSNEYRVNY